VIPDKNTIIADVLALAEKMGYEVSHARQVKALALDLFDLLSSVHGLGEKERLLLECASILHDIGVPAGGGSKHHKLSRDLIISSSLDFYSPEDKIVVALVARYHKGQLPDETHRYFSDLSPAGKILVSKLSAILRIADGLDRGHADAVRSVGVEIENGVVLFRVDQGAADACLELAGAREKADLFEKVFCLKAVISA
jgi:exopolyphosphatase/guanosine-5'-triphosphate,3'-diphosphate pyrophosphatase